MGWTTFAFGGVYAWTLPVAAALCCWIVVAARAARGADPDVVRIDWVIIDTPPVLAVTDAVILAPKLSGMVFVIGSEMTRIVHAERALETIRASRPRAISAVLNRVDFDRNKYYYSRYYGYQYKSYYGPSPTQGAA